MLVVPIIASGKNEKTNTSLLLWSDSIKITTPIKKLKRVFLKAACKFSGFCESIPIKEKKKKTAIIE